MEIKQGDKVKVSKDAPKVYLSSVNNLFKYHACKVEETDGDSAKIHYTDIGIDRWLAIPTKYLVKVDAEAKEAKIKLGDMVRVKGNLHEPFCLDAVLHLEITNMPPHAVSQKEWKVIKVENRRDCAGHIYTLNRDDSFIHNIPEDCVELIEPTEHTEAEKKPNHTIKIPVEVDLTDSYWDAYTADLAKELAIAYGKRGKSPLDAVAAAKEITKRLKQK